MAAEVDPTAVVHPGTVLGEGVKVMEHAVVGKQPTLSPRSTAKREPLPPSVVGDGTVISTSAIVFAGSTLGARVIVGDQACVRERVSVEDDVVIGRGALDRERHVDRRAYPDSGRRLRDRLLDARGGRVRRALRGDDERQLHGAHRGTPRRDEGADDPARRAGRGRRDPLPRDRDRRGGVRRGGRGGHEGRACTKGRRRQPCARPARRASRKSCSGPIRPSWSAHPDDREPVGDRVGGRRRRPHLEVVPAGLRRGVRQALAPARTIRRGGSGDPGAARSVTEIVDGRHSASTTPFELAGTSETNSLSPRVQPDRVDVVLVVPEVRAMRARTGLSRRPGSTGDTRRGRRRRSARTRRAVAVVGRARESRRRCRAGPSR